MRHGFLLVDKPIDITSHDAVSMVRRGLHERSIGHLGTLDPAATGLLVLAVGKKALKVIQLFEGLTKEYEALVRFGFVSSTYDREGAIDEVPAQPGWQVPSEIDVRRLIDDRFIGRFQQVPPAHSAVHVGGERAYRKARQGREVNIPPREVEITRCDIVHYEFPDLTLDVACGSGTYIRSLAHDLGRLLHFGAYLAGLRRTKVGQWSVDGAKEPEQASWTDVIPLKEILADFPRRELSDDEWDDVRQGRNIEAEVVPNTIAWHKELPVALLIPTPDGTAHARKVF